MLLSGSDQVPWPIIPRADNLPPGRRVLCRYRDGAYAIAAESWSTMTAGVATSLTASCQVEDYLDLSPVFENIAAGMVPAARLPGPQAGQ